MGNWRRVRIQVKIPHSDVGSLESFLKQFGDPDASYIERDTSEYKEEDQMEIPWDNKEEFPDYKDCYDDSDDSDSDDSDSEKEDEANTPNVTNADNEGNADNECNINNTKEKVDTIKEVPVFMFFYNVDWVHHDVDHIMNIGREPSNDEIMKEWRFIVTKFPRIKGVVHVCDDWESDNCVGRVVLRHGRAEWRPPTLSKVKHDDPIVREKMYRARLAK